MMHTLVIAPLVLALSVRTAPPASTAPAQTKFAFTLRVRGRAGQPVQLRAIGVPPDYIASFCTDRVCAPFAVTFVLPRSGRSAIELALIENRTGAPRPLRVTVAANGARTVSLALPRARPNGHR
jgi:hypothetical protein